MATAEDIAKVVAALSNASNAVNHASSSNSLNQASTSTMNASLPQYSVPGPVSPGASKYNQLLALVDELGKDIRPTYTGNRNCAERLKRGIIHARVLVRECLHEVEKNARQTPNQ